MFFFLWVGSSCPRRRNLATFHRCQISPRNLHFYQEIGAENFTNSSPDIMHQSQTIWTEITEVQFRKKLNCLSQICNSGMLLRSLVREATSWTGRRVVFWWFKLVDLAKTIMIFSNAKFSRQM